MKYKIEQLSSDRNEWIEIGESISRFTALRILLDLKKHDENIVYRIISVLDVI